MTAELSVNATVRSFRLSPKEHSRFDAVRRAALGRGYDLSLVFIGDRRARTLNRRTRGKDSEANVLSFPLAPDAGEIYVNVRKAAREARAFGRTARAHVAALFIHGVLHLKGHVHGDTMEREETRLFARFF